MRLIRGLFGDVATAKINDVRDQWRRRIVATGVMALCALAALCGLGFITVGSYLSLREGMVPWKAGLIGGGAMLALALIGALSARLLVHRRKATQQAGGNQPPREAARIDSIARLGETIGASICKQGIRATDVVIGALVAGVILGARPALRQRLLRPRRCGSRRSGSHPDRRTTGR
jgi:hypothetical protein